jgi:uncharacterized protein (TIGR04255 family)
LARAAEDARIPDPRVPVTRRIYPKPPIVEALIEFRFEPRVHPAELATTLRAALGDTYDSGDTRTQDRIDAQVSVSPEGGVATAASRTPHAVFLQSATGHRLLGCSPGALSIHTLAPYPGWESFILQAREAVAALPALVADGPVLLISVRYIDRIELPREDASVFSDYIAVMPPRPGPMPSVLSACFYGTQARDAEDGTIAQLTIASAPGASGVAIQYDLLLQRGGSPPGGPLCTFSYSSWGPIVDALHVRQREIFEASITDKTRGLFQ